MYFSRTIRGNRKSSPCNPLPAPKCPLFKRYSARIGAAVFAQVTQSVGSVGSVAMTDFVWENFCRFCFFISFRRVGKVD